MTRKLKLDIPIVLPGIADIHDGCITRLVGELQARDGVEAAHIVAPDADHPPQLCIHYDPDVLSLLRIRELVSSAGARISERYGHVLWQVEGLRHERRARTTAEVLRALSGVLEAQTSAGGLVRVEFDRDKISEQAIRDRLRLMGIREAHSGSVSGNNGDVAIEVLQEFAPGLVVVDIAKSGSNEGKRASRETDRLNDKAKEHQDGRDHEADHDGPHSHNHAGILGRNTELIFSLICGAALGLGYLIDKMVAEGPTWAPVGFYLVSYFFGGLYTLREAIDNLRLKKFEIDTLMLVAAAGAAALGAFAEGALLLFLFSLGHALEHFAMGRAKQAIEALAKLAPPTATIRRHGETREVPIEDLVIGDVVIVRPNERLPADGFVAAGETTVNQSPVTGESIPVDKRPVRDSTLARTKPSSVGADSKVFAGTINGAGAIEIEVTRLSSETALAKVVEMVSQAETQRSPTQRLTDKFERIFVPAVLLLAFGLLFAWVVVDEPFSESFYRAMAVLVAASPCALAIATPSAVLSGVARAARGGVLIKGGAPLETLGAVSAIAFDKTGTLTEGRPRITDIVPAEGVSEDELLRVTVAVEQLSDHPLANAIVKDGRERLDRGEIFEATNLKSLTGRGVSATLDGRQVWIGKAEMFGTDGIPPLSGATGIAIEQLRGRGRTTMAVRSAERDMGVIGLMDTPRSGAREALQQLHALGITRMIMISGDHQKVADAIAREIGLDEAWGDLMPEGKVQAIRKLRAAENVAMVGDGVNDAPAMASATVGIAMGAAGSDVALETADVALMADDLRHLPFAVELSRHTRSIIRQNVFISLGVVAILLPATVLGLGIGPAVAMHEGSTLIVVFNALRLLAYRDRRAEQVQEAS